jgi:hypothetical protein
MRLTYCRFSNLLLVNFDQPRLLANHGFSNRGNYEQNEEDEKNLSDASSSATPTPPKPARLR